MPPVHDDGPQPGPGSEQDRSGDERLRLLLDYVVRGDAGALGRLLASEVALREELEALSARLDEGPGCIGVAEADPRTGAYLPLLERLSARYRTPLELRAPLDAERPSDGVRPDLLHGTGGSNNSAAGELNGMPPNEGAPERYRLHDIIAQGGMGSIVRAWDTDLRRALAMKLIGGKHMTPDQASSRRIVSRFLDEAQITAQLDHPGIVPVHDLGLTALGEVYYTMPLIKGLHLGKVFHLARERRDGWTPTRAVDVLRRVAEAMSYAHSRGVLHRDLKPANVMVGRFGEVYVMDWGLACVFGQRAAERPAPEEPVTEIHTERADLALETPGSPLLTATGEAIGTTPYMPPEQVRYDPELMGPPSDVYAAGAMLYELLCVTAPYMDLDRDDPTRPLHALDGPPTPIAELNPTAPPELRAIAERAMQPIPAERYADMSELSADLSAYLENRVVRAHRTGRLIALEKWLARNRALAIASAAGLMLSLAGLVALLVVQSRRAGDQRLQLAQSIAAAACARAPELLGLAETLEAPQRAWVDEVRELLDDHPPESGGARFADRPDPIRRELASLEGRLAAFRPARDRAWTSTDHGKRASLEVLEYEVGRLERRVEQLVGMYPADAESTALGQAERPDPAREFASSLAALSASGGWLGQIEADLAERERIEELVDEESGDAWREAAAAIAAHPLYGSLSIAPQTGLVPLAADPESGLWEFWLPASGTRPERGRDGRLALTFDSGVVMVLIPAGNYLAGVELIDSGAASYMDGALPPEGPPTPTQVLAPYFLSKYELTQGQWLRLTGSAPSSHGIASYYKGARVTPVHPLETLTWFEASRGLAAFDLELPTEAWWEWAARAGDASARPFDPAVAHHYANFHSDGGQPVPEPDGHKIHAPVDHYEPNPWGLFGMFGNIEEHCRDAFQGLASYDPEPGPDGERLTVYSEMRSARGGSFSTPAAGLYYGRRSSIPPQTADRTRGLRPARALQGLE